MQKIRVLVADDHTILREGVCALLALMADVEVVGEATNGREALQRVKDLSPDVVVMDIAMPIMSGLEAARRIRDRFPSTKALILSQYDDREHVFAALEAGAMGFVSKTAASTDLAASIRSVARGDSFLSPSAARLLVDEFQQSAFAREQHDSYERLTDREREILKLVAEGYTTHEMAEMLVLSPKTIEGHRHSLMSKLGVRDRIELIKYALRKGIIKI